MKADPTTNQEIVIFVLAQIEELEVYLNGVDDYNFFNNNMLKDACLMKLLAIGEYTKRITDEMKDKYPEVEWRIIAQARNFYAHGYGAIEWPRVWETLAIEIPKLKIAFQVILNEL